MANRFTPIVPGDFDGFPIDEEGVSLRDWFAGQALTGIIARLGAVPGDEALAAESAYVIADAMMEARSK